MMKFSCEFSQHRHTVSSYCLVTIIFIASLIICSCFGNVNGEYSFSLKRGYSEHDHNNYNHQTQHTNQQLWPANMKISYSKLSTSNDVGGGSQSLVLLDSYRRRVIRNRQGETGGEHHENEMNNNNNNIIHSAEALHEDTHSNNAHHEHEEILSPIEEAFKELNTPEKLLPVINNLTLITLVLLHLPGIVPTILIPLVFFCVGALLIPIVRVNYFITHKDDGEDGRSLSLTGTKIFGSFIKNIFI